MGMDQHLRLEIGVKSCAPAQPAGNIKPRRNVQGTPVRVSPGAETSDGKKQASVGREQIFRSPSATPQHTTYIVYIEICCGTLLGAIRNMYIVHTYVVMDHSPMRPAPFASAGPTLKFSMDLSRLFTLWEAIDNEGVLLLYYFHVPSFSQCYWVGSSMKGERVQIARIFFGVRRLSAISYQFFLDLIVRSRPYDATAYPSKQAVGNILDNVLYDDRFTETPVGHMLCDNFDASHMTLHANEHHTSLRIYYPKKLIMGAFRMSEFSPGQALSDLVSPDFGVAIHIRFLYLRQRLLETRQFLDSLEYRHGAENKYMTIWSHPRAESLLIADRHPMMDCLSLSQAGKEPNMFSPELPLYHPELSGTYLPTHQAYTVLRELEWSSSQAIKTRAVLVANPVHLPRTDGIEIALLLASTPAVSIFQVAKRYAKEKMFGRFLDPISSFIFPEIFDKKRDMATCIRLLKRITALWFIIGVFLCRTSQIVPVVIPFTAAVRLDPRFPHHGHPFLLSVVESRKLTAYDASWALVDALPHGHTHAASASEMPLTNSTTVTVTVSVPSCTTTTITLAQLCTSWAPLPWIPTQSDIGKETSIPEASDSGVYTTNNPEQPSLSTLTPVIVPTHSILTDTWYSDHLSGVEITETILPSLGTWTDSSIAQPTTTTHVNPGLTTTHPISGAQPADVETSGSQSTVTRTVVVVVTTVLSTATDTPSPSSKSLAFEEASSVLPIFSAIAPGSALLDHPTAIAGASTDGHLVRTGSGRGSFQQHGLCVRGGGSGVTSDCWGPSRPIISFVILELVKNAAFKDFRWRWTTIVQTVHYFVVGSKMNRPLSVFVFEDCHISEANASGMPPQSMGLSLSFDLRLSITLRRRTCSATKHDFRLYLLST
ncbi:hypothetical protein ACRALDRAFT_209633 [Sodiomyces alcalophilus JCM 7366]|uniref:uncharacterized protein n=1 Tax=Sodiomyces alcalophilus JCM 7366 TaxID=591952 RepID=UPI0039B6BDA9